MEHSSAEKKREKVLRHVLRGCLIVLLPSLAGAQAISGTVTDTTGGVLPGVTVEARSPEIIEQVRTAVTDGSGNYSIVALESGTYSVTYSLPGFGTLVRDGIQLTTGFTASIDVQLSVGDIAETVTVSGASPVVDIQNVDQRQVVDREVIDSIPTGKSMQSYALLVPGMEGSKPFGTTLNQDSGGQTAQGWQKLGIHGGVQDDQDTAINGMSISEPSTLGITLGVIADGNYEEMSVEYSAHSAEVETGGVRVNVIPREGANTFSGAFFGTFASSELQAANLDQDLRDRGLGDANELAEVWLINPSLGGPIVRDRLWFFLGHTSQRADSYLANTYLSKDPTNFGYVPDLDQLSIDENHVYENTLHLTWQATQRDKVKLYWSNNKTDKPHALQGDVLGSLFIAPDAALHITDSPNTYQATWVRPQTNRLLFEGAVSMHIVPHILRPTRESVPSLPGILDVPNVLASRNAQPWLRASAENLYRNTHAFRGSASFVTGSHNLKFGVSGVYMTANHIGHTSSDWVDVMTLNGAPLFAMFRTPARTATNHALNLGFYVQEQWTLDRLTVNAGVRFDRLNNGYPDQVKPASRWASEPFPITGQAAVTWHDIQPRLGVAYDLFGDGRTALKASASRYGEVPGAAYAIGLNPAGANALERRFWRDLNGDGYPQGDPLDPAPNGELFTPLSNPAFGRPVITTFYDEAWAFGWGNRFSNWELSGSVQHELRDNVSLDVGYFRRTFVNFSVQDNRALAAGDFDEYTVLAPADSRLPEGGGYALNFVDINPAAFGRLPDTITSHADAFGGESRTWNGVDLKVDARLQQLLLQGGVSTGKTATDYCALASAAPETLPGRAGRTDTVSVDFCQTGSNWLTQVKMLGSYTLPYDIQIAGTYQSLSGPERGADFTFAGDQILSSLGRPLAGGGGITANILEPGTVYGERFHQVDLRLTKIFALGGNLRIRAMFDLYNLFNANAVTNEEYALGANYLKPVAIMPGRLAKFAFQFNF